MFEWRSVSIATKNNERVEPVPPIAEKADLQTNNFQTNFQCEYDSEDPIQSNEYRLHPRPCVFLAFGVAWELNGVTNVEAIVLRCECHYLFVVHGFLL